MFSPEDIKLLVIVAALNFATEVVKAFRTFWNGRTPDERANRQASASFAADRRRRR